MNIASKEIERSRPRVLVVGCGAIGGTILAHLAEQGFSAPLGLSTNPDIRLIAGKQGLRITGLGDERLVPVQLGETPAQGSKFDWIFLAVQPPQAEEAVRGVLPHLAADGAVVCFQNGLMEERIAGIVGAERVLGAIVAWGASMPSAGVCERTSAGGFVIGRIDGRPDPRLRELDLLLEAIGPVSLSNNLRGARWSKLAMNSAISSLGTIGRDRLGALLKLRFVRRLALEIMTECVEVALAEGVSLEKVSGTLDLEWLALTAAEKTSRGSPSLVAKHSLMLAVGSRYRKLRSSMLRAIEAGREPAVDFLNGEIVSRGAKLGIPTPVNSATQRLVHAVAQGEDPGGIDSLRQLAQAQGIRIG